MCGRQPRNLSGASQGEGQCGVVASVACRKQPTQRVTGNPAGAHEPPCSPHIPMLLDVSSLVTGVLRETSHIWLVPACRVWLPVGAPRRPGVRGCHESDEWPSSVMDGEHLWDVRRCPPGDIPDNGVVVRASGSVHRRQPLPRFACFCACFHLSAAGTLYTGQISFFPLLSWRRCLKDSPGQRAIVRAWRMPNRV